uniref:Uncharacterized protein n=1 Tax=Tanacetum cinerariifolium TaxID=118510 RepID=A0A699KJJ6_TANCI|nr:hypothetical protein [Tanacetum cinerariifolium]
MNPLAAQLERKPRMDRGTRRGRHYTSSSTFNEPSSSHLNDDEDDGNNEGTSRASTPSPIRIMVNLIFLEGLYEEALVEFMVEWCEEDKDDDNNEEDNLFN